MQSCAGHSRLFMVLPLDKWGPDHLGVLAWVGGLGHCKQAHRKGRFILLRVSWEGIEGKVPWSSHLVKPQDAPGRHHVEDAPHAQGISCACWPRKWRCGVPQVTKSRAAPGVEVPKPRWALDGWSLDGSLNLPSSIRKRKGHPLLFFPFLIDFFTEREVNSCSSLESQVFTGSLYFVFVLKSWTIRNKASLCFTGKQKAV